jgi:hypothetical protein
MHKEFHMITRQKLAAGLGGLTLMLGTLGGAAAVYAASPPAAAPPAIVQPAQAETETADGPDTGANVQDQQGSQVEDGQPDTANTTNAPDTDNVQNGFGSQVTDGTPDVPGAVTP